MIAMPLQPIEAWSNTDKFLKAPRCGAFKNLSGFLISAKRCIVAEQLGEVALVMVDKD
jgi:hypothetical protein